MNLNKYLSSLWQLKFLSYFSNTTAVCSQQRRTSKGVELNSVTLKSCKNRESHFQVLFVYDKFRREAIFKSEKKKKPCYKKGA